MAMGANHKTMLIFILIILILAIVILVGLPSSEPGILMFDQLLRPERDHMYSGGLNPTSLPAYLTDATFPKPPHGSAERIIMFAGKDLRRTDLSRLSQYLLSTLTFDMNTRWPASTTVSGFSPSVWLERGKYPGLRIKTLHAQGVMGQGVGVAVFDKPILRGHHEFKGRLVYRRLTPKLRRRLHFHGISCASILAGQTCGVAPKADLYYIAVPDVGQNFFYYTLAMGELMKINRKLPQGRKVRIVSISDGIAPDNKDRPAWEAAISEARKQGIAVLYSNTLKGFTWGGCPPNRDRDNPENYDYAAYIQDWRKREGLVKPASVIVPADYRTTASNQGPSLYMYWGEGGFSWAIPYVAGLAAMAWQVFPDISLEEILDMLEKTARKTLDGDWVISPIDFIDAVRTSYHVGKTDVHQ